MKSWSCKRNCGPNFYDKWKEPLSNVPLITLLRYLFIFSQIIQIFSFYPLYSFLLSDLSISLFISLLPLEIRIGPWLCRLCSCFASPVQACKSDHSLCSQSSVTTDRMSTFLQFISCSCKPNSRRRTLC